MTNSYFPSDRMIRDLFAPQGFREYESDTSLRIGGRVFFRRHHDGRLQMLYVFTWSNFVIADRNGTSRCILWIRPTLSAIGPEETAWRSAPTADGISFTFDSHADWQQVASTVRLVITAICDGPQDQGEQHLAELISAG